MYRNIILEFLANNDQTLHENGCYQMTIVLFPSQTLGCNRLFKEDDDVTIYHIKNPYTFEKTYSMHNLEGTIVELLIEDQNKKKFSYSDFQYEIKDPYYLKDIREQKFLSIEVMPIFTDNDFIACALNYSNKEEMDLHISNKKWSTFIHKLLEEQDKFYSDDVLWKIIENENLYYIVKNINRNKYFMNKQFQDDYQYSKNLISVQDKEYSQLKKHLSMFKKIVDDKIEIYYLAKNLCSDLDNQVDVYLFALINHHHFKEKYAFIFAKDLEDHQPIIEFSKKYFMAIKKVIPDSICKFYQIDKNTVGIVINREIKKKEEVDLRFILKKEYFILVNFPKNLSLETDLEKLSLYLNDVLPTEFNLHHYKEYCHQQNLQKLECDSVFESKSKIMIKADTMKTIGQIINPILPDYYSIANYQIFENAMINMFDTSLKKDFERPIFTILTKSLARRKIYEQLKKIIIKYPETKIILHTAKIFNESVESIYHAMIKIKELGYIIIIDSSIFMSLEYNICLKLADAILIRKNELTNSLISNNPLNQRLFNMYYEYGKVVIFEGIPKECDVELINELTCLIIDKN